MAVRRDREQTIDGLITLSDVCACREGQWTQVARCTFEQRLVAIPSRRCVRRDHGRDEQADLHNVNRRLQGDETDEDPGTLARVRCADDQRSNWQQGQYVARVANMHEDQQEQPRQRPERQEPPIDFGGQATVHQHPQDECGAVDDSDGREQIGGRIAEVTIEVKPDIARAPNDA